MNYSYLTTELRCQIYALQSTGMDQKNIAEQLDVSSSMICREFKRHADLKGYHYNQAHEKALGQRRQVSCRAKNCSLC